MMKKSPQQKGIHGRESSRRGTSIPEISVLIPTYNRKATLELCLAALGTQTLPREQWEVIVVDDGSTDGTEAFCKSTVFPFGALRYMRQVHKGAGAARRRGVSAARGKLLLFLNDDSIASPGLLAEHSTFHRAHPEERWAMLGSFVPTGECNRHVLSLWLLRSSFLYPQNGLVADQLCDAVYFITCNLSIARKAVIAAGSFDATYCVGEDTELGARLGAVGYRVKYHPDALAYHEHGAFTADDLQRRAKLYGPIHAKLFRKHPNLIAGGTSPFGTLSPADYQRMEAYVMGHRRTVESAMAALHALDQIDLFELARQKRMNDAQLRDILEKVAQLVPIVYWHGLFESFLRVRQPGSSLPETVQQEVGAAT